MRVTSAEAHDLFSFDRLCLGDLPQTLVVVGPNGSGKTNLLRLFEIVRVAVDRTASYSNEAYQALRRFTESRRIGAASENVPDVRLGIELTEPWERAALACFVRAAIASSLLQHTSSNADTGNLTNWLSLHVNEALLEPLTRGEIIVEFTGTANEAWAIAYEFDALGERFRWVLEGSQSRGALLRAADAHRVAVPCYTIGQKLDLDDQRVPQQPLTLAGLLPPPGEGRMLTLEAGTQWAEMTREFTTRLGLPWEGAQRTGYSLAHVLHAALDRGLVLLSDLRQPPRAEYTVEDVAADPLPTDGSMIPVRLFRLKNGPAADRRKYRAIQEQFTRLTGQTFDIAFTHMPLSGDEDAPGLRISVLVGHGDEDLPVEFTGAGIWEALLLSAVLPDSAGMTAVLDEPARNLHPTLQRRLLTAMREATGQFILTTHSPYLVSMRDDVDMTGVVRFGLENSVTRARRLDTPGPPAAAKLRKALGESADARSLLFARGVVLVEGGTELGALPEWFSKSPTARKHGTPDDLNVVIFSVDGDGGFGTFAGFLQPLGVPWAVVCDGAVYQFGTRKKQIFDQLRDAGAKLEGSQQPRHDATFAELRKLGEDAGIFSLAETWEPAAEGFETFIETVAAGMLADAEQIVGRSKPRQGRHVASATSCPPQVDALYTSLLRHLGVLAAG